jgi:Family of unknown function (DUF5678)
MRAEQRSKLLREAPRDCWVAIAEEEARIVAHGRDYSDVVNEAENAGFNDPLMIRIPKQWAPACFNRVHV